MRHYYFRLFLGIVWLAVAAFSAVQGNVSLAALYLIMGNVFLGSAYSIRKKEKDNEQ